MGITRRPALLGTGPTGIRGYMGGYIVLYRGCIGIMEKKMEATIRSRV